MPHYLRFARALALLGGLGACGARQTAPEPAPTVGTNEPANRNGETTVTPPTPVAPTPVVSAGLCDCSCHPSDTRVACAQVGTYTECCEAVIMEGPLPPPDLPA